MGDLRLLIRCILGPNLYSFYKLTGHTLASTTPEVLNRSHRYLKSPIESASDIVVRVSRTITYFGTYISPVIFTYLLYKRNVPGSFVNSLDHSVMLKLFSTAVTVAFGALILRGLARYSNPEYIAFLRAVEETKKNPIAPNKRILNHFDADFSAYPVDFKWSQAKDRRPPAPHKSTFPTHDDQPLILERLIWPLRWPLEFLIALVMKTVGRRLIYPGSLSFLQALMQPAIFAGRAKLIEEHNGVRYKLESYDSNSIDTMFIDRRGSTPNGDYLVIGCEGNGGFYEIGTILTPLEGGYSVLGWNHPGFGGSTGIPYPDQDVAAVDTVIKFATDRLNFEPNKIILYGWSIGGFTATWAGMRYPNIHGLVIDASFDHIVPLARNIFPSFMYPIVQFAIKRHFDLDNSRHVKHFNGPIILIRRSQDEVISLDPYNSPPTNRANYLLIDLLKNRFPKLMDDRAVRLVQEFLGGNSRYQDGVLRRYSVSKVNSMRLLLDYFRSNPTSYPVEIGPDLDLVTREQLVLFLASMFMVDYDSVHCAPLPARYFQRPWNLIGIVNNSNL